MTYETRTRKLTRWCIALLVVMSAAGAPRAAAQQEVGVSASSDSSTILMGNWIYLTIQAKHPSSMHIAWPALKDSLGPFDIVQTDSTIKTQESNGVTTETRTIALSRYEPGAAVIPPVTVSYRKPNDTTAYTAQSNPISIEVRGIAVDTTQAIKDIKPPLSVPISLQEIAVYSLIILVLCAIGYGAWWYWKRRRNRALGIVEEKPAIPPDVLALAQLHELEEKHVWQRGEVKLFYSEATEIVRRYFEGRYGVMALEMTTDEVLDQLAAAKLSKEMMAEIRTMLAEADLVKFAKVIPSVSDNERVIPKAMDIVERTKPAPMPVPEVEVVTDEKAAPAVEGGATNVQ